MDASRPPTLGVKRGALRVNKVYQLDFLTPGINPLSANFLNINREIPNFLMIPLDLPVIIQKFLTLVGPRNRC